MTVLLLKPEAISFQAHQPHLLKNVLYYFQHINNVLRIEPLGVIRIYESLTDLSVYSYDVGIGNGQLKCLISIDLGDIFAKPGANCPQLQRELSLLLLDTSIVFKFGA